VDTGWRKECRRKAGWREDEVKIKDGRKEVEVRMKNGEGSDNKGWKKGGGSEGWKMEEGGLEEGRLERKMRKQTVMYWLAALWGERAGSIFLSLENFSMSVDNYSSKILGKRRNIKHLAIDSVIETHF
jgi:hypothetical protein